MQVSTPILDIRNSLVNPELVKQYSQLLEESPEKTEDFLSRAIPAIVTEIASKSSNDLAEVRKVDANVVQTLFGSDLNFVMVDLSTSGMSSSKISKGLALAAPTVLKYFDGKSASEVSKLLKAATTQKKTNQFKEFDYSGVLFFVAIISLMAIMVFSIMERVEMIPIFGHFFHLD